MHELQRNTRRLDRFYRQQEQCLVNLYTAANARATELNKRSKEIRAEKLKYPDFVNHPLQMVDAENADNDSQATHVVDNKVFL